MKKIVIIAAVAEDNTIGNDNKLPWKLPNDFKRFKKITSGHHIIMGRKTFESLPGLLPNRTHVVITRDESYSVKVGQGEQNVKIVHNLEDAISLCPQNDTSYIIGGGEIYSKGMEYADELDITHVLGKFEGDTKFPEIDSKSWLLVSVENNERDEEHDYDYSYLKFIKQGYPAN